MVEVILVQTNKQIIGENLVWRAVAAHWVMVFMATLSGFPRRDYFSVQEINNIGGGPYRLNCWMSGRHFGATLIDLIYTKKGQPLSRDKFWEGRDVISVWKKNMKDCFSPSYMPCLDESISIWNNKWSCPG